MTGKILVAVVFLVVFSADGSFGQTSSCGEPGIKETVISLARGVLGKELERYKGRIIGLQMEIESRMGNRNSWDPKPKFDARQQKRMDAFLSQDFELRGIHTTGIDHSIGSRSCSSELYGRTYTIARKYNPKLAMVKMPYFQFSTATSITRLVSVSYQIFPSEDGKSVVKIYVEQ